MHGQFLPFKALKIRLFLFLAIFKFEIKSKIFLDNSKCTNFPSMSHAYSETSESGGLNGIGQKYGESSAFFETLCAMRVLRFATSSSMNKNNVYNKMQ